MDKHYNVTRHICPRNCYSSCGMLGYGKNGKLVKVTGDPSHGYTNGKLCPKGYNYLSHVYHPDRLKFLCFKVNEEVAIGTGLLGKKPLRLYVTKY